MVSEIEVEIATTIIQLTGVLLPILAGSTAFYIVHEEKIDKIIQSHDETLDDASIERILEPLYLSLLLSYLLAIVVIQYVNIFLFYSLLFYGAFLFVAVIGMLVVIDASLVSFGKAIVKANLLGLAIIIVLISGFILISWNTGLVLFMSVTILLLFSIWSAHSIGVIDVSFPSRSNHEANEDDTPGEAEEIKETD